MATATNQLRRAAIRYAELGWRVIPLRDREKAPRLPDWPRTATTDRGTILHWWDQYPDSNVGVALGVGSGIVGVDRDGPSAAVALEEVSGGDQPDTCEFTTPNGQRLLYAIPERFHPRSIDFLKFDDGELKFMSDGRQTVMPPSVHPGSPERGIPPGLLYEWVEGRRPKDLAPAPMPGWLVAEMCRPEQAAWVDPQTPRLEDTFPPGADFNRRADWDDVLSEAGFRACRGGRDGVRYFVRPGKVKGVSVSLGHYRAKDGTPALHVFSTSIDYLQAGKTYDLFGFAVRAFHKGDFSEAARQLSAKGYGTQRPKGDGKPPAEPKAAVEEPDLDVSAIPWPDPLAPEALHGLAGDVVGAINPHTEADPAAILFQFLVAFGNMAGRKAFYGVEASRHYPNLFVVLVGRSARARKGTSWQRAMRVLERGGDQEWCRRRIVSGLSSGEGLIWEVRDPIVRKPRKAGEVEEVVDPGMDDKRVLVIEEEFASVLAVGKREGNILGSVMRNAWDHGNLGALTKNSPAKARGAHVSIISHITRTELLSSIALTQAYNGFLNRFLWAAVRRSKLLPYGGANADIGPLAARLEAAWKFAAEREREVEMTVDAQSLWGREYERLTADRTGLFGAITSRAEAQSIRLALVYALLDSSESIEVEHLKAALAVEKYVQESARYIFGEVTGDPTADAIRSLLRANPGGVTETQIRDHFGRNKNRDELQRALGQLVEAGLASKTVTETGKPGRPTIIWKTTIEGTI